jgi:translation initiation factor 2B subunit (eIF-2B alpha/beta/delta family)
MEETLRVALGRLKADVQSGASELLPRAMEILRHAVLAGDAIDAVAREVCLAQPSMAPMWNAALAALAQGRQPESAALDRFEQRRVRAGDAMTRVAVEALRPADRRRLHVVTVSYSGSVLACLRGLGRDVRVSCAEGRPALEGRRLAAALARDGVAVDFFTDAALAGALHGADGDERVVLVGADAVAPDWVVNKVGTGMLAAAASRAGVPVYVAATRDKFVDARVARLLSVIDHDPGEVWDAAPAGVAPRNPYFERMGLDLVDGVLTDAGMLTGAMIGEACRAASAAFGDSDIARLGRG